VSGKVHSAKKKDNKKGKERRKECHLSVRNALKSRKKKKKSWLSYSTFLFFLQEETKTKIIRTASV
jgi:hypothetical protein